MADYSVTQDFGKYSSSADDGNVVIKANNGSVAIYALQGDGTEVEVPSSPFTEDVAFAIRVRNGKFRVRPSGGATYSWNV